MRKVHWKKLGNILCPITDNSLLKESILKCQLSIFLLFHNIRQAKMVRIFFQTHILADKSACKTIRITFVQRNFTLTCVLCLQIKVWLRKPRKTCELARWKIFEFMLKKCVIFFTAFPPIRWNWPHRRPSRWSPRWQDRRYCWRYRPKQSKT